MTDFEKFVAGIAVGLGIGIFMSGIAAIGLMLAANLR